MHALRVITDGRRVAVALLLALAAVCVAPPARADDSLANQTPADVGMFVEMRAADDLLVPLSEPRLWLTFAKLAGQPARLDEAQEWGRRVQQTVRMSPADAIRALFSQRVAFFASPASGAQDAVVLCRPARPTSALIQEWPKQPLPNSGRASLYRLSNGISLASYDGLLLFGDGARRDGLMPQVLRLSEPDPPRSLVQDPSYLRLLERVPANPDGVLFVRLRGEAAAPASASAPASGPIATASAPSAAASAPAPGEVLPLPAPLRGADSILLALHRRDRLLHFTAVGDAPQRAAARRSPDGPRLRELLGGLPERTLAAWAVSVDFSELLRGVDALPPTNPIRVVYRMQEKAGIARRLTDSLAGSACVAVGVVMPDPGSVAPPAPSVGLLLVTRDAEAAEGELRRLFDLSVSMCNLLALQLGAAAPKLAIDDLEIDGRRGQRISLAPLLPDAMRSPGLGRLELCWARDHDVILLASHEDWLRQLLDARAGRGRDLSETLAQAQRPIAPDSAQVIVLQTGPIADLGDLWLRYLGRAAPDALNDAWWRDRQPGGRNVQLGIQARRDGDRARLIVESVAPGSPADGVLRAGDALVGCSRRRFVENPIEELRRGIAQRPDTTWVDLIVERDGSAAQVRRVPLPFVNPVELLRQAVAVGRMVQRVVYAEDAPESAGPRGVLTVEMRLSGEPLFRLGDVPAQQPVGADDGE